MKRSKSSFYHAVNFYPIGMQLMPKCSQFNAQSCDMRRYALYRVTVLVFNANTVKTLWKHCENKPLFLSEDLGALLIHSCRVFSQHPEKHNSIFNELSVWMYKILASEAFHSSKNQRWPRGSVRRWTLPVAREVFPLVCTAPPTPSRTRCPGRCSSPQTLPCGSGRSSRPAGSAQTSSSPHGNS